MAIITSTLVWLFNFKAGKASDHRGEANVVYDYLDKNPISSGNSSNFTDSVIQNVTIPVNNAL